MEQILQQVKISVDLFTGDLVVGNHDTITLFGVHPQTQLQKDIRNIARYFLKDNSVLDAYIGNIMAEIDKFDVLSLKKSRILSQRRHHKELIKTYQNLVSYINEETLYFKMQQARLLKEIKLLERLEADVAGSATAIDACLNMGDQFLKNRLRNSSDPRDSENRLMHTPANLQDLEYWYSRLANRLDDLRVSYTIALQTQAQIQVLKENDQALLNRLSTIVTNTFPIWQTQMAMILKIEKTEHRAKEFHLMKGQEPQKASEHIMYLNSHLKQVMSATKSLEIKDINIRKEFQNK